MAAPVDPVTLHVATSDDVAPVARMLREAATWLGDAGIRQWSVEDFSDEIVGTWLGDLYVARRGEVIVGAARLMDGDLDVWPETQTRALVIHRLVVARLDAGRGTGREILAAAARLAAERHLDAVRLDCWSGNSRLRELYAGCGFTHIDDRNVGTYDVSRFEMRLAPA